MCAPPDPNKFSKPEALLREFTGAYMGSCSFVLSFCKQKGKQTVEVPSKIVCERFLDDYFLISHAWKSPCLIVESHLHCHMNH